MAISLDRLEYAGTGHDPLAAVVFAAPVHVDHTYVHGRPGVSYGELVTADVGRLIEDHGTAVRRVVAG